MAKAKNNLRKCNYSHCKHDSKDIDISSEQFLEEKGKYYHPDCKHEKDIIYAIKDYWYKNIDKDVIFNQLTKIIERLIYKEGYEADYILYALKIKAKYLNHPPGLVYAVKDKKVRNDWEFEQKLKSFKSSNPVISEEEPTFTFKGSEGKKKFGDIFGG